MISEELLKEICLLLQFCFKNQFKSTDHLKNERVQQCLLQNPADFHPYGKYFHFISGIPCWFPEMNI